MSNKTETKISIESLFLTFDGDIKITGVYLEDKQQDTLIYSKSLEANLALLPLITGKSFGVDGLDWEGVRAHIWRKDSIQGYNFGFLADAFASDEPAETSVDTTSSSINLILRNLDLKDFEITYVDDVTGIDTAAKFDELLLDLKNIDLENMAFDATDASITKARINVIQNPSKSADTTSSTLPALSVKSFILKEVEFHFKSNTQHLDLNTNIADFNAEESIINIATNTYTFEEFTLNNSLIAIARNQVISAPSNPSEKFEWPDFTFNFNEAHLENNTINYFVNGNTVKKGSFNPNALAFENLSLSGNSIYMNKSGVGLNVEEAQFQEGSGLNLKHLMLQLKITDKNLTLENLDAALNHDKIAGHLEMTYPELDALMSAPEKSKMDLMLSNFSLDLNDLFLFQPDLKTNEYLLALSKRKLTGNGKATGYVSNINIPNLSVYWGDSTKISAHGTIKNATKPDSIKYDIPEYTFITQKSDIARFVTLQDSTVTLPNNINLSGRLQGSLNAISTNSTLTTNQGIATVDGNFKNLNDIQFKTQIKVEEYELNKLLNIEKLGKLTATVDAEGGGKTINDLDAKIKAVVNNFSYNEYPIENLEIDGDIKKGQGEITSVYKDQNIDIDLDAFVILDSIAPELDMDLHLAGANLQALGLTEQSIKTGFTLSGNFKGDSKNYDAGATLSDGVVVYESKTYLLGDLKANAHVREDTTSVQVENKILNLDLQSNATPLVFSKALKHHVLSYFYRKDRSATFDTLQNPVELKLHAQLSKSPVINNVFLVNLKEIDTVKIDVEFKELDRQLVAIVDAPHINYSNNTIDSLSLLINTYKDEFLFNLGFNEINAGPLLLPKTFITGVQKNNELQLDFNATYKDTEISDVRAVVTGVENNIKFHVFPEGLKLNKENWNIPEDNAILFTKDKISFNNFKITKDEQSVELTAKLPKVHTDHIAVEYKNFKINEILDYFNPETPLAEGILNGDFIVQDPLNKPGIIADLDVSQFKVKGIDMGTLNLHGKSLGSNNYAVQSDLGGGDVTLNLKGKYKSENDLALLDIDINIEKFNMHALEGFTGGEVKDTEGDFSGVFKIKGTTSKPNYNGNLNFNNAKFNVSKLNNAFTLSNESIKVDNKGVYFTNFTIRDEKSNTFDVSGKIGTESYINPTFDLNLKAENFQVLNATKDDNELIYGKLVFDAEAHVSGDLEIPKIDMKLNVDSETDVTYVLPSASVDIEKRDGIVIFVNREHPDDILTQEEEQTSTFTGLDVNTFLQIGDNATLTVVLNDKTNDNFNVFGKGEFNFTMKPNGQMNLAGVYNVSGGHYEMSLYHLVNRRFELAPESRVTWSGNPFDAEMDIKAIYNLETSATGLMASSSSGANISDKSKFQQVVPFYVYLNIDGELSAPKISFSLDMPESDRGIANGQVYGRVQQINQEPDALNKQVFSLLVLNRFYPDSNSDGSAGGFNTIARDNLNSALSDQLNVFSDKLLNSSGFNLDFKLNSFTDYQGDSPMDRTELNVAAQQKLFSDRLIVKVGSEVSVEGKSDSSHEAAPLIGNVSLEYLLTKDGRYTLKGFRKNEYENVIDGQTITTGISLLFTREFNKFRELWDAMFRETQEEHQEKTEDTEAKEKDSKDDTIKTED
ncbi:translocation/assembly module TamB domain-containing protein [Tamlana sp. I1]|uniref:translocation/assembly module TamB domain-containing protein n=1 Tax=Tamlana sp. I1 TaxID=2762061 RepID=UPI00293B9EBA|nr:translocation/assembly module TamB domain-containing protein [Tamlana sp. I1]